MPNRIHNGVGQLWQDMRFAFRTLRKSPGFVAIAVLTLALGIGASTTVFSVAKRLVMEPVPYPEASRLVNVWTNQGMPLSTPDYLDMAERNASFSSMAAFKSGRFNLGGEQTESVLGITGTPSLLPIIGVPPMLGRWFNEGDAASEKPQSVIISHGLWTRAFGRDPAILGRTLRLNGAQFRIIGVMPEDYVFESTRAGGRSIQFWLPMHLERDGQGRGQHWLEVIARLKAGASLEQADADVKRIGAQLTKEYPITNQHKPFLARSYVAELTGGSRNSLPMILGAVGMVLLMACANVASMLLARGSHRQTEFAVRFALGATRGAVIRLCLVESLILALLGTMGGIAVTYAGTGFVQKLLAVPETIQAGFHPDGALLVIGAGLALFATFLAGLPSALTAARAALSEAMKAGGRGHTGSRTRRRFMQQLVAIQILQAFLLVNGAVLLSASYLNVWKENRNLDTNHTITAGLSLEGLRYDGSLKKAQFWEQLLARVRAVPGVVEAGVTTKLPLDGGTNSEFLVEGEVFDPTVARPWVEMSSISPGYFPAAGIPLLRGQAPASRATDAIARDMNEKGDRSTRKFMNVVVNRAFVDHYWPGQDPIGKQIRNNTASPGTIYIVVGEAENVRQWGAEKPAIMEIYWPYSENSWSRTFLVVRSDGDAQRLVPDLRRELAAMDADLAFSKIRTLEEVLGDKTSGRRLMVQVINSFMALAVLLALVGVYGTVSYNVARQNKEVGIRMVLGAQRFDIVRLFLRQLLPAVGVGLLLGVISALASTRFIQSFVYRADPANPWLFAGIALALFSVSLFIAWLPAMRASRLVPMDSLKAE